MEQRFEQIYAEHSEAVRANVRRRAPEAVVDDIVSETFVVCLRKIDRVPPEPLPPLYAVARKTLAHERRKGARVAPSDVRLPVEPEPAGGRTTCDIAGAGFGASHAWSWDALTATRSRKFDLTRRLGSIKISPQTSAALNRFRIGWGRGCGRQGQRFGGFGGVRRPA
jgi:DNA-directed RNA polymerase specialized sigma24 family protein